MYTPAVHGPDVPQHPTTPCIVSRIHDDPGEHVAALAEFPPNHPHIATSNASLLNNLAGSAGSGMKVGRGDQASALYACVCWASLQGSALLPLKTMEKSKKIDEGGIAKILKGIVNEGRYFVLKELTDHARARHLIYELTTVMKFRTCGMASY